MKICYVVDDTIYRPAGVQYAVLNFASYFRAHGHAVTILHCPHPSIPPRPLPADVEVVEGGRVRDIPGLSFNGSVSPVPVLGDASPVRELMLQRRFDVMHFNYPYSPFVSHRIVGLIRELREAGRPSPRVVMTPHTEVDRLLPRLGTRLITAWCRSSIRVADAFTHSGEPMRRYAEHYMGVRSRLIPFGQADVDVGDRFSRRRERTGVLFLGRLDARKGVLDFLRALARMPRQVLDRLDVRVAGDGPQRQAAEDLARTLGVPASFAGRVSEAERDALYARADLAVFPAHHGESFGLVIVEAMNRGCAIAGYANVGYADTLGPLAEACLTPPGDVDALACRIRELVESPGRIEDLGRRLKDEFRKKYSLDVVGPQLLAVYSGQASRSGSRQLARP